MTGGEPFSPPLIIHMVRAASLSAGSRPSETRKTIIISKIECQRLRERHVFDPMETNKDIEIEHDMCHRYTNNMDPLSYNVKLSQSQWNSKFC